jgi:uncharacterized protein (DUF2164 family)
MKFVTNKLLFYYYLQGSNGRKATNYRKLRYTTSMDLELPTRYQPRRQYIGRTTVTKAM